MTIANCRDSPLYTHVAHYTLKGVGSWLNVYPTSTVISIFTGKIVFTFEAPFGYYSLAKGYCILMSLEGTKNMAIILLKTIRSQIRRF
jgi:hypothetical protein